MKLPRTYNSFFYKLMSSYLILVITISLLISVFSVYYYSEAFKKNLSDVNQKVLSHLNVIVDETVIHDTVMTYVNMSIHSKNNREYLDLYNVSLKGNHDKIVSASEYLQYLVNSSNGIIESIHVYYKDNDIILSSNNGLVYRNEDSQTFNLDTKWLDEFQKGQTAAFWLPKSALKGSTEYGYSQTLTYVKGYPTLSSPDNYKGVISININDTELTDLLVKQQKENESLHIIDADGNLVATTTGHTMQESFKAVNPYLNDIAHMTDSIGDRTYNIEGIPHIISYSTIATNGWRIIHVTSIDDFYKELNEIRFIILVISLSVVFLGLLVTVILTRRLYNPLKRITKKLGESLNLPSENGNMNRSEYNLINKALDNLTNEVHTLKHTVDENKPLIKHNIITGLLNHTIKDQETYSYRMAMLDFDFEHPFFNVIVLKFKSLSLDETDNTGLSQTALYNLIKIFEQVQFDDYQFLATELSDSKMGIILNSEHDDIAIHIQVLKKLFETLFMDPMVYPYTFIGRSISDPWSLYRSYTDAETLQKYHYFEPSEHFFSGTLIDLRETSTKKIDPGLIEQFGKALNMKNITHIDETLQKIVQEMQFGPYSYEHCNAYLINMTSIVSNFIKDLEIDSKQIINKTVLMDFKEIDNIILLKHWLLDVIRKSFDYLDQRSKNKNYVAVDKAKAFILAHLEEDLSLDIVADEVSLSPRYLSKLFKEYTGENFTEFVNRHKMDHAKDLILNTKLTISAISDRFGFSSPAYFIKKFKVAYGMTPNEYRVQQKHK